MVLHHANAPYHEPSTIPASFVFIEILFDMQRLEVIFRGRVQGVGFRYSTRDIAKNYSVTGFVRNEPNGTVFLTAEGERTTLEEFLESILKRMQDFIHDHTVEWSPATNRWSQFQIEL